MQTDLLLINVPRISLVYPPAGTSLLKGVVEQQGGPFVPRVAVEVVLVVAVQVVAVLVAVAVAVAVLVAVLVAAAEDMVTNGNS